jgi:hypothetical protein
MYSMPLVTKMSNRSNTKYFVKHFEVVQKTLVGVDVGNEWVQNSSDNWNGYELFPLP